MSIRTHNRKKSLVAGLCCLSAFVVLAMLDAIRMPTAYAKYGRSPQQQNKMNRVADRFCDSGYRTLDMNNPQLSIKYFERALKLNPRYVRALVGMGSAQMMIGNYREALKHLTSASRLSNDPDIQEKIAICRNGGAPVSGSGGKRRYSSASVAARQMLAQNARTRLSNPSDRLRERRPLVQQRVPGQGEADSQSVATRRRPPVRRYVSRSTRPAVETERQSVPRDESRDGGLSAAQHFDPRQDAGGAPKRLFRQSDTGAAAPRAVALAPLTGVAGGGSKPVTPADRPVRDKWALIIGISKFQRPKYNLEFAAKDAQDFYNYLTREANFKPDHVKLLLNEQATRANIMSAFGSSWLPRMSEQGDLVVVYVSTHGTPANKDNGGRNYIVAYDTNAEDLYPTGVDMDEVYKRIKEGVKTDRALIILDTCYSGGALPSAKGLGRYTNFDIRNINLGRGHLVISSSSPGERSWESKRYSNSVFTHQLISALRKSGKKDIKSAFDQLSKSVRWEVKCDQGKSQTPQLGGKWEGADLVLSVPASEPRSLGPKN